MDRYGMAQIQGTFEMSGRERGGGIQARFRCAFRRQRSTGGTKWLGGTASNQPAATVNGGDLRA
jgi:hypothetical protein